jgi:hypothetical protein
MVKRPRQPEVKISLRLPAQLHRELTDYAADCSPRSSLNGEIVSRLYASVQAASVHEARHAALVKENEWLKKRIEQLEKLLQRG